MTNKTRLLIFGIISGVATSMWVLCAILHGRSPSGWTWVGLSVSSFVLVVTIFNLGALFVGWLALVLSLLFSRKRRGRPGRT